MMRSITTRTIEALWESPITTPGWIWDGHALSRTVQGISEHAHEASWQLLYSLKACSTHGVLNGIVDAVHGFACSSLFEARLAREMLGDSGTVHITTPGLRADEIETIAEICDYVTFNSFSQWDRFRDEVSTSAKCGLRVNPQLSFVEDERYDPCRRHSKLGVPMSQLVEVVERNDDLLDGLSGIHFHTNCDSDDMLPLLKTVHHVDAHLSGLLSRMEWINLGGGYLFNEADDISPFEEAVAFLHKKYDLEIFVEPGADLVRSAGYMVSTVIDMFHSDGKTIAILDTTVNHMAEVLEFQYRPPVVGDTEDGEHRYILAGCTCLAGDVFGEYGFDEPLAVGSRVIFPEQGAYSAVKWHWFNGVNLPTIYALTEDGQLVEKKRFTNDDFAAQCGARTHAAT